MYITIHSQKKISIAQYCKAWKTLKAIPEDKRDIITVNESLCTWWPVTVRECLKQYTDGVHDRINIRGLKYVKR